jgi:bifunctional pyridoxal-dependent enzyme with beta-cystathionase and maltose regulon repressor activities
MLSTFALITMKACYKHGRQWLTNTLTYIADNLALIQ